VIELIEEVVGPPVALEQLKEKAGRRRTLRAVGSRRTAIVKAYESERAPVVAARIAALSGGPPEPVVPEVLGMDAGRRLVVLSDVPGTPLREAIIAGDAASCARAGGALARWHRAWRGTTPDGIAQHTSQTELEVLRSRAREAAPDVRSGVEEGLTPLDREWDCTTVVHRDLYEEQVLLAERVGLIDLDDAALGPAELDVGNLLAHVELLELRMGGASPAMGEEILRGYGADALDPGLLDRCRKLALLRLACIHGQQELVERARRSVPLPRTKVFVRDDGSTIPVVEGFRERVLSAPRVSVQPKRWWSVNEYEAAAEKKLRGLRRLLAELGRWGGSLDGASVLEVGCGPGIDCMLLALHPVARVVGIDLEFPLEQQSDHGERTRRLTRRVLEKAGVKDDIDGAVRQLPVQFVAMDATRLEFPDESFDLLISRAALEHIVPIERALAEMARVVRPGGLLRHGIDQFFWLRGCHKRGVVDIPWAHARLRPDEFRRFVAQTEGEAKAERRTRHLETLNQLNLRQWRALFEASPFEIVDWREEPSRLAHAVIEEHPDVPETLLDGVTPRDLLYSSIKVWLRKP
jgi:SAM-dependent methyltransferase